MITNKDLEIQNTSYTNKDFESVYTELLDLIKKITNKWDPETSNESDPGVVLIKLLAFIADKLNYNIDKNILEQFITSATQKSSFANLCEMMGYRMKYYRSATTKIAFSYLGGQEDIDTYLESGNLTIKAFDTRFKTEDNIIYTLLEDISIGSNTNDSSNTKMCIQGELKPLTVTNSSNESTKIQIYNLDDNNRLYFPDTNVAENGIFINKEYVSSTNEVSEDDWQRVDNLNDQEPGKKVYKFGYDSEKQLPYIEFPEDVSSLFEDGIEVWYILSDGKAGYCAVNTLTSFDKYTIVKTTDNSTVSFNEGTYAILNGSSIGAADPETINEAYNNFKRTIGTFDTLVSCRDYANAIYNYIEDETNNRLVSNCQVSDLRTDPNRSTVVLTRGQDDNTAYKINIKEDLSSKELNEIKIHGTRYVPSITNASQYKQSYSILTNSDLTNIDNALDEFKTVNHILTLPVIKDNNKDFNFIKNMYSLKIKVSTKYKVNTFEQNQILSNIKQALYTNFNARQIDFGEEIPYDSLLSVIENSDERIKNVVLDEPVINSIIVDSSGEKFDYDKDSNKDKKLDIITKNIVAGRISLYIKDNRFSFDYNINYATLANPKNVSAITGSWNLPAEKDYKLNKNEVFEIVEESYITKLTYPAYVYYSFKQKGKDSIKYTKDNPIPVDTPYRLQEGDELYIYYTDSDDVKQFIVYKGTNDDKSPIFKFSGFTAGFYQTPSNGTESPSNISAARFANFDSDPKKLITKDEYEADTTKGIALYPLGTNEEIQLIVKNETLLNKFNQKCYWYIKPKVVGGNISNEEDNLILYQDPYNSNSYFYILEDGEMFVYTDEKALNLYVLGAGSKIEVESNTKPFQEGNGYIYLERQNKDSVIILDDLNTAVDSGDVATFQNSFKWNIVDFSKNNLHIIETTSSTNIEGDTIKGLSSNISSDWVKKEDNSPFLGKPLCRTLLLLESSSDAPQKILAGQTVTIYSDEVDKKGNVTNTKSLTLTNGNVYQIYPLISTYNNVVLRSSKYEESIDGLRVVDNQFIYNYDLISYSHQNISSQLNENSSLISSLVNQTSVNNRDEYVYIPSKGSTITTGTLIDGSTVNNKDFLSNLYIGTFTNDNNYKTILNKFENNNITINVTTNRNNHTLITKPLFLTINPLLTEQYNGLSDEDINTVIGNIEKDYPHFDYLYTLNTNKLIASYDVVHSFFDKNNIYNRFTIAEIDFDSENIKIEIIEGSKK